MLLWLLSAIFGGFCMYLFIGFALLFCIMLMLKNLHHGEHDEQLDEAEVLEEAERILQLHKKSLEEEL